MNIILHGFYIVNKEAVNNRLDHLIRCLYSTTHSYTLNKSYTLNNFYIRENKSDKGCVIRFEQFIFKGYSEFGSRLDLEIKPSKQLGVIP
jgi:hypothetical protein